MPLTPCLVVPIELIRQKDRKTTQRFRGNEYQDRRKLLNYRDKETNEAGIVAYHAYRRKNAGIVADKVLGASQWSGQYLLEYIEYIEYIDTVYGGGQDH